MHFLVGPNVFAPAVRYDVEALPECFVDAVSVKLGLEFLMLTACRPGEVRGARWEGVDLESGEVDVRTPRPAAVRTP